MVDGGELGDLVLVVGKRGLWWKKGGSEKG